VVPVPRYDPPKYERILAIEKEVEEYRY